MSSPFLRYTVPEFTRCGKRLNFFILLSLKPPLILFICKGRSWNRKMVLGVEPCTAEWNEWPFVNNWIVTYMISLMYLNFNYRVLKLLEVSMSAVKTHDSKATTTQIFHGWGPVRWLLWVTNRKYFCRKNVCDLYPILLLRLEVKKVPWQTKKISPRIEIYWRSPFKLNINCWT